MEVLWTVHTDTKKEKSGDIIFRKLTQQIKSPTRLERLEKYYKDETIVIYFYTRYINTSWEQFIYSVLSDAQCFGRAWQLFGDISCQSSGLSRDFNISGIVHAEFHIEPEKKVS